jgi:hypothetical protein
MGFFSNSDHGDAFEADQCARCVHRNEEKGCPVLDAHVLFAYGAEGELKGTLDTLIVPDKSQRTGQRCAMFVFNPSSPDPKGLFDGK